MPLPVPASSRKAGVAVPRTNREAAKSEGTSEEEQAWQRATVTGNYEEFLKQHNESGHAVEAKRRLVEQRWEECRSANTLDAYRKFLGRFPGTGRAQEAKDRIEELSWADAQKQTGLSGLKEFLAAHPGSPHAGAALALLEQRTWEGIQRSPTHEAIRIFLESYPQSRFSGDTLKELEKLDWGRAESLNTVEAYRSHMESYPDGPHLAAARERVESLSWKMALAEGTGKAFRDFAEAFPNSSQAPEARAKREEAVLRFLLDQDGMGPSMALFRGFPDRRYPALQKVAEAISRNRQAVSVEFASLNLGVSTLRALASSKVDDLPFRVAVEGWCSTKVDAAGGIERCLNEAWSYWGVRAKPLTFTPSKGVFLNVKCVQSKGNPYNRRSILPDLPGQKPKAAAYGTDVSADVELREGTKALGSVSIKAATDFSVNVGAGNDDEVNALLARNAFENLLKRLSLIWIYIRMRSDLTPIAVELAHQPQAYTAWIKMGDAHQAVGYLEDAKADYQRAVRLESKAGRRIAEHLVTKANSLLGEKESSPRALWLLNIAVETDATFADAFLARGRAHAGVSKHEEALADFDKALELNPKCADAIFNRAWSRHALKRDPEAIEDYNAYLKLRPGDAGAYANRGTVYCSMERLAEAVRDWKEAVRLEPSFSKDITPRIEAAEAKMRKR